MKVTGGKVDAFLKSPPKAVRAVLFFGPDAGMVRERGAAVAAAFVDPADPFGVEEFTGDVIAKDPAKLADTARAMSLMGGSPVVRVRDASDSLASVVEGWLAEGGGIHPAVFEAGELTPRSKLRALFESRDDAAAIGCYSDEGRDLRSVVMSDLSAAGVGIADDAMGVLLARLGADRLAVRQEIAKLVLYAGGSGTKVSVADVETVIGDAGSMSLDDIAFATGGGDMPALQTALARAQAEGQDTTSIMRGVLRHFERLHEVVAGAQSGGIEGAIAKLRPQVFYKLKSSFAQQARQWKQGDLARALALLLDTDRQMKSSPNIEWAMCERTLMQLAQAARRRR